MVNTKVTADGKTKPLTISYYPSYVPFQLMKVKINGQSCY